MEKVFRILVVVSYALYVAFFFMPYLWASIYDQQTQNILSWTGYGAVIPFVGWIGYCFFTAYSLITVGLLFTWPLARFLFTFFTVGSITLVALQGVSVLTASEGVILYIMNLIDGALIAIMYFTSFGSRFVKRV